ncbi:MAG: hypothetical protein ACJAYB_001514 [Psychromonas sp.]|jgi:hypothetical protein
MATVKLDKKDYRRALLTDTFPSDVPVIFSNDGLYLNSHRVISKGLDSTLFTVCCDLYSKFINPEIEPFKDHAEQIKQSSPFKYKIIKDEVSLRTLSLVHPRAQINYANIYRDYSDYIISLCEGDGFSIRAPMKLCNSFYAKGKQNNFHNKYKDTDIETLEHELHRKHASSYFSYKGYDRIYKLYSSPLYIELESKFPNMWYLDVANCFDTIYTHTISWATKGKEYIKDGHIQWSNQFCQKLDTIMQRSNNNETNGIPIGSEFSRIFAEILFQSLDKKTKKNLSNDFDLKMGTDYVVLRYVDDYVVFGANNETCKLVSKSISDCLSEYNLFINKGKTLKYLRPFSTDKSYIISHLLRCLNQFEESLFDKDELKRRKYKPRKIYKKHNFKNKFISEVRTVASKSKKDGYSEVSSYLISFFSKRIQFIISNYAIFSTENEHYALRVIESFEIMTELMFFYYKVNPSVTSANKVSKTVILMTEFMEENSFTDASIMKVLIVSLIEKMSFDSDKDALRNGYISIEKLNVILSTSDFGEMFRIPSSYFEGIVSLESKLNYFEIISLLYYFKNHDEYIELKKIVMGSVYNLLSDSNDLTIESEAIHLALDIIGCPYVDKTNRVHLLKRIYGEYIKSKNPSEQEINNYIDELEGTYWFVKWKGLDIKKLIERNELKSQY